MFPVINRESVLSGFQWFFFIFCNTVVVPPTLLSAFHLPADNLLMLTQYAFLTTALACLVQAFCGHRRAIMEGPTGLWWGGYSYDYAWRGVSRHAAERYRLQPVGRDRDLRDGDDIYRH